MALSCQCPAAASLPTLDNVACTESFGQIQKIAFQRLAGDHFTATAKITALASWEALIADAGDDKIIITPYVYAPADSGGDARMSGGGNDDLGGIPTTLGSNPVQFTASLRGVPQSLVAELKKLMCEANAGALGVYLFDENGNIEAIKTGTDAYAPIPVRALFVGDKVHGNYDAKDSNVISWYFPEGYSDKLEIIKPADFNPLTDLQNA